MYFSNFQGKINKNNVTSVLNYRNCSIVNNMFKQVLLSTLTNIFSVLRSIGVSNFGIHHLEELKKHSNVIPSINQIEVHPFLQERDVVNYCRKEGIVVQAYSPLTRGKKLGHPSLTSIGNNHGKTTAQILLRWCVQSGYVCIPKSSRLSRIEENASIFDFHLSEEEMAILNGLEEGFRTCRPKIQAPWNG